MYFLQISGTENDSFFNLKVLAEVYPTIEEAEQQKKLTARLLEVEESQIEVVKM